MGTTLREFALNYIYNALCWLSQGANALLLGGDPDESLSSRIGKNIRAGGLWSRVPLPRFLRSHFAWSIEDDRGRDSAAGRASRG